MSSDAKGQPQNIVHLENRHIILTHQDNELVRISVDDIKLIGEYTTGNGPLIDDWFIVFMTSPTNWIQISHYTAGMQEVLHELGQLLHVKIVGSLSWSTSWKTSIIWPPSISEMEMWDVHSQQPETLWQKLNDALGTGSNQTLVLTPAAASTFV